MANKYNMIADYIWKISNSLYVYKIGTKYMLYNVKLDRCTDMYDVLETISYKFFILYNNCDKHSLNHQVYNMECELIYTGDSEVIPNDILWKSIHKYKGDYLNNNEIINGKMINKSKIIISLTEDRDSNYGTLVTIFGKRYANNNYTTYIYDIESNYYSYTTKKWLLQGELGLKHIRNIKGYDIVYGYIYEPSILLRGGIKIAKFKGYNSIIDVIGDGKSTLVLTLNKDLYTLYLIKGNKKSIIKRINKARNIKEIKLEYSGEGVGLYIDNKVYDINKDTYMIEV